MLQVSKIFYCAHIERKHIMKEYKIALLGNFGTGRSTTVCQLVMNKFIEKYDPTIEDV